MTSTTRAGLLKPLNGLYLLCSWAQYPVDLRAFTPVSRAHQRNVGCSRSQPLCCGHTLTELWLTRCHGNCYSPIPGQKCFFLSPCTTQTARTKHLTESELYRVHPSASHFMGPASGLGFQHQISTRLKLQNLLPFSN